MLVDCDGGGDNRNDRVVDIVIDTGIRRKDVVVIVDSDDCYDRALMASS